MGKSQHAMLRAAGAIFLVLVGIVVFGVEAYAESRTIGKNVATFKELSQRFELLAEEKGGAYAFEVLKRAELPPQTDIHLLGHAIGDVLYRQEGVAGIARCTQDFRNACSHTIVIGALDEFGGEQALDLIREACEKAPGGSGAYTMCYHGLGHGVFAYHGYDLEETVRFCSKTGTVTYGNREHIECVGGAIMELMGGGGHDEGRWQAARERYLDPDKPLSPCLATFMPEDVRGMCLTYLTPRFFELAGLDLGLPDPAQFPAAFAFCDTVPETDRALRNECYSGFGKEFIGLAVLRDTRRLQTGAYRDEELAQIDAWCGLAGTDDGRASCTKSAVGSLFWGGENDPDASYRFCELVSTERRSACFGWLAYNIALFVKDAARRAELCARIPESERSFCI